MDLVLFIPKRQSVAGRKLQEVLNNDLPDMRLELFTDFEELVTSLGVQKLILPRWCW